MQTHNSVTTQRYIYGMPAERLFAQQNTTKTWYRVDALNSVRALLDAAGLLQDVASYDAWGVPETSAIAPFGFTGELQRGSDVWLRARWYGAGRGGFGARDPFAGFAKTPYSMHYYQYGYSNPVSLRDPSGRVVPETHVTKTFSTQPNAVPTIDLPHKDCITQHDNTITLNFIDLGIVFGAGGEYDLLQSWPWYRETVYDLLTFERGEFSVVTNLDDPSPGWNTNFIGIDVGSYVGGFTGISNYPIDEWGVARYSGAADYTAGSIQIPFNGLSGDFVKFTSRDGKISGSTVSMSIGVSLIPLPFAIKHGATFAHDLQKTIAYRTGFARFPSEQNVSTILKDLWLEPNTAILQKARATDVIRHNAKQWEQLWQWYTAQSTSKIYTE